MADDQFTLQFEAPESYRASLVPLKRTCRFCRSAFTTLLAQQAYCSNTCRAARWAQHKRIKSGRVNRVRSCRRCGTEFAVVEGIGSNRQHCGPECSRLSQRRSVEAFYERNPEKKMRSRGSTTVIQRLYRRYPDLPRTCEANGCTESRVLEAAHRPGFERRGAWRTMNWYERHMFWMLCPTHHKLIDMRICTPVELGLPG